LTILLGGCLRNDSTFRIVFRADGSDIIGLGHVVRCISLIQILSDEFECLLICRRPTDVLIKLAEPWCKVYALHQETSDNEEVEIAKYLQKTDILVLDGYNFTPEYQLEVSKYVKYVVVIDDISSQDFYADVIINHGSTQYLKPYRSKPETRVFSGFSYLIARREFLEAARRKRKVKDVNTIFICMGGSDPFNITPKVLQASIECDFITHIIIVIGALNKEKECLERIIRSNPEKKIELIVNADAISMVEFINKSQIAMSTASSVALEICCVKSALICGTVIENQFSIHQQLIDSGCCKSVGDWRSVKIETIKQLIFSFRSPKDVNKIMELQNSRIDGNSGKRILSIFKELSA